MSPSLLLPFFFFFSLPFDEVPLGTPPVVLSVRPSLALLVFVSHVALHFMDSEGIVAAKLASHTMAAAACGPSPLPIRLGLGFGLGSCDQLWIDVVVSVRDRIYFR